MSRNLSYHIDDVLDILNCAEDYGFHEDILIGFLLKDKNITEEEIENYCKDFLTEENRLKGYTIDDYEESKERLTEIINTYKNE